MSGAGSRRKGANAERELFKLLNTKLGYECFKRNLEQTRNGGCDDGAAEVFALECKRAENLNLRAAIEQAKSQAKNGQIPVLAHRRNKEPWQFLIVADLDTFATLFELIAGTK